MIRFLRLFAAFRQAQQLRDEAMAAAEEYRASAERENGAKIEAQDRVRELEATVTNLNGALAEANAKTVHSVQCVADWLAMQRFGLPIYGVAPVLPEGKNVDGDVIPSRGIQGRALAQQLEDEFMSRQ